CGYVAIVGRPNVGKSTLLNHILGQKLAITSRKPQTTRHNMLGIKTEGAIQAVYVDTPGLHSNGETALNRYMNRTASSALKDVDVVVFVVDRTRWTDEDQLVLDRVKYVEGPLIVAVNKTDRVEDKAELLPHFEWLAQQLPNAEIVPISAQHGQNLEVLEKLVAKHLPEGEHFFPEDQITDRSSRFLAAELVREKIMRQLGAEVPYQIDRKSTRLNSSHVKISYAVFCLKKKKKMNINKSLYLPSRRLRVSLYSFTHPAPTEIYTLSLHDALPI